MKLYSFDWGIYPRRLLIYLSEKGLGEQIEIVPVDIMSGETRSAAHLARNPAGTVPVLEVAPGTYIRQSASIMEYLEELYPSPNMLGRTPEARAATRDLVVLANETFLHLSTYLANASPAFVGRLEQRPGAAIAGYENYQRVLGFIEQSIGESRFLAGEEPTIADCVMFASAQFAELLYEEPLPRHLTALNAWFRRFSERPSATAPTYPAILKELAPIRDSAITTPE